MMDTTNGHRMALTFEAGGDSRPVEPILQLLQAARVQATFFIDGQWADANPDLMRQIAAADHEMGNHGYRHPDWTSLSDQEIVADLQLTEAAVRKLVDRDVKPWARPPFGAIDSRVLGVLARAGYHAVYRDAIDGGHWPGETTASSIYSRALQCATDKAVIVLHTNVPATVEALPRILHDLKQNGFRLGTLSTLGIIPLPRMERHPDFLDLDVRPGYIRPRAHGRWQSLSLLEIGALANRPVNHEESIVESGEAVLDLITGDAQTSMDWALAVEDRHVLVLAGGVRCDFHAGDGSDLGYLIARTGDIFLCPRGTMYQLGPEPRSARRWIAVVWRKQSTP